jgi:hypothetical protein
MDWQFFTYGLLLTGAVTIITWRRIPVVFKLVGLALIAVIAFAISPSQGFLSDERWYDRTPYREILLFLLMLAGMIARYFTRLIEERRNQIATTTSRKKPRLDFDLWEFSYPLFISVITFGVLMAQIGDESLSLADVTLSFQTGFFWQTVLGAVQQGTTSAGNPPSASAPTGG